MMNYVKKYNDIWNKLVILSKKNLIGNPSKIKNSYKTKIKYYGDDTTGFHAKKPLKLALIIFDGR